MRMLWMGLAFGVMGCGGPAEDDTETADDTAAADSESGPSDSDPTDSEPADSEPADSEPADSDSDEPAPFSPVGTWSLTGGAVSARVGSSPPCPAVGQAANSPAQTLTWGQTGSGGTFEVTLSNFTIGYDCSLSGNTATCTARDMSTTAGSGYFIGYQWPMTITLGAEGAATVAQTSNASCNPVGSGGSCAGVQYCESVTSSWSALKD